VEVWQVAFYIGGNFASILFDIALWVKTSGILAGGALRIATGWKADLYQFKNK
jgi:hypothetical protein